MTTTYYILCEDMASALIGPFSSRQKAELHQKFCEERGDGSALEGSWEIISNFTVKFLNEHYIGVRMTPEEDKQALVD